MADDPIIVVAGLTFRDDTVLLVRKDTLPYYIFPGGKWNGSESFRRTLQREIEEELDCYTDQDKYIYIGTYFQEAPNGDKIKVIMFKFDLKTEPTTNAEIVELVWWNYVNKPDLAYPFTETTEVIVKAVGSIKTLIDADIYSKGFYQHEEQLDSSPY